MFWGSLIEKTQKNILIKLPEAIENRCCFLAKEPQYLHKPQGFCARLS